jgi:hypothetical protein
MAGPFSRSTHHLLSLLILCAVTLVAGTVEVDIISPVAGGRYRVNPDRGLGVVITVQNKDVADTYGWKLAWKVTSTAVNAIGVLDFAAFGDIGAPQSYEPSYVIDGGDPYIALSHSFIYSGTGKTSQPMPPGDYRFSWNFTIGPWCESFDNTSEYDAQRHVGDGSFSISVADDAPWPAFTHTDCASVAGQVSFASTAVWSPPAYINPTAPLLCVATASVTDPPNPCRVTVKAAQAASISSIMTWSGSPRSSAAPALTVPEPGPTDPARPSKAAHVRLSISVLFSSLACIITCISV